MGLFDFFKRRSARERAIPGADSADAGTFSIGAASQQPGPAQGGSPATFVTQSSQTIDARNVVGLRDNVLEILKRHGIDPMSGQTTAIDASKYEGLAEEIQGALAGHGIQLPAVSWSPEGTPGIMQIAQPPAGQDTDHRLRQLTQLRDSGLITPAEFEQQRSRILGEI
jgi:hypothetical protein